MSIFTVSIRVEADSSDEVIERVGQWGLGEQEGVMNISQQPEMILIPQELMPPPPPMPEMAGSMMPPPLPESPATVESSNGG